MLIQGNTDDRGSREYNLGLGQRRADAVKRRLVLLGATESQIESVSLGEEKPVCTQQTEECWARNRRADILYGGEY
jgi:peptidoglycan-associated lipoprotein